MPHAVLGLVLSSWLGSLTGGFVAAAMLCEPLYRWISSAGFEGTIGSAVAGALLTVIMCIVAGGVIAVTFVMILERWLFRVGRLRQVFRVVRPGQGENFVIEHLTFTKGWELAWPKRSWKSAEDAAAFLESQISSCNEPWECAKPNYARGTAVVIGPLVAGPATVTSGA